MGLSETDAQEPVNVTLCIEDWAVIMVALSAASVPLSTKSRINDTIFESARATERVLS